MAATLTIRDEALSGRVLSEITLDFFTEHITVRDLICRRVREEVRTFNLRAPRFFEGLVTPTKPVKSIETAALFPGPTMSTVPRRPESPKTSILKHSLPTRNGDNRVGGGF